MGKLILLFQTLSICFQVYFSLSFSSSILKLAPSCRPEDSSSLLQFKKDITLTDQTPYSDWECESYGSLPKTNSWNGSTDCCTWEGVTCDKLTGHVLDLDFSCAFITSIPAKNSLLQLPELKRLNLAYNQLNDSIANFGFGQFVSLTHLNLSSCELFGLIPSDISFLSKLVSLDLSGNFNLSFEKHHFDLLARNLTKLTNLFLDSVDMSSVAPNSMLNLTSSLKQLGLKDCKIDWELPTEVFNLPNLNFLDLSYNLGVSTAVHMSNWNSPLVFLDLSYCQLNGSFPISFRNLTKINDLILTDNNFQKEFPDIFGNLTKLTSLDLSKYWGDECVDSLEWSRQLPLSLFNLTQLEHLDLSCNSLEGRLPNHVSGLQSLQKLALPNNHIKGGVPSWVFTLPSSQYLDLSNNRLIGQLSEIEKANSVEFVNLALNNIRGPIPSFFFNLENLTYLDLSSNNFSSVIQSNILARLIHLQYINVSNNAEVSLSSSGSVNNYTFPELQTVSFFSCNVRQFPSFLRNAMSLSRLDLSNNKINGSILRWESEGWEALAFLNLSYNSLTHLEQYPGKNLQVIDLHSNQLQGPLLAPPPSVQEFYISGNRLTGNIPPLICKMGVVEVLDLAKNNLGGSIPTCLVNSSQALSILDLQMNNFHGKIPAFENDKLQLLALDDNQLEGPLPRSLRHCTFLNFLSLANNSLNDSFPYWLGVLPDLQVLKLGSNRLHGSLENIVIAPNTFTNLQIIDLSNNEFSGRLPIKLFRSLIAMKFQDKAKPRVSWKCEGSAYCWEQDVIYLNNVKVRIKRLELELRLGTKLPTFTVIDFSVNQFYGEIPQALGELGSLIVLNLSHNSLVGSIPRTLGKIEALESLDLSSNKLTGEIPSELTQLTFLAVLNISNNDLEGKIPAGKQFDTFENDSYMGNSRLCGLPLSRTCNLESPPSSSDNDHEIPFFWKVVMMGYGCGTVLGLSAGYIVFTTKKPWWFVKIVDRLGLKIFSKKVQRTRGRRR